MNDAEGYSTSMMPQINVEHIRTNPTMYLGGIDFFGFVNYLVSAFDLLLVHSPTWIEIELAERMRLTSDACISTELNENGLLEPFETVGKLESGHLPDAMIVMALSDEFLAAINDDESQTVLTTRVGKRQTLQQDRATASQVGTELVLSPDASIFSTIAVSPAAVHSYCKRMACLHLGVKFRINLEDEVTEYTSTNGMRDLFAAVTTPYQILHEPIHIRESEGDLTVEAVFAFHSWTDNRIWSYANRGRVPQGGTHETGLRDAIHKLRNEYTNATVGFLAVLAIEYPGVVYEGCIKAKIANSKLRRLVRKLVAVGVERWIRENDVAVGHLKTIEKFRFSSWW